MIIDDIADLMLELRKTKTASQIGEIFGRKRKTIYAISQGCTFHLDYDFIAGLSSLGYELKLVKRGNENANNIEGQKDKV